MSDVTRIVNAIEQEDAKATDELLPLVYEDLRILAAQEPSHEPLGQTVQATALVHEAYIRLAGDEPRSWNSRGHFFAAAVEAMRRVLARNARQQKREKHGGDRKRPGLVTVDPAIKDPSEDITPCSRRIGGRYDEWKTILVRCFCGLG
jgi:RNA polymerase sigma factor (TIGR02999 family)